MSEIDTVLLTVATFLEFSLIFQTFPLNSCVLKKLSVGFSHMNTFGTTDLTATFCL